MNDRDIKRFSGSYWNNIVAVTQTRWPCVLVRLIQLIFHSVNNENIILF